jgi:hypothetical protein
MGSINPPPAGRPPQPRSHTLWIAGLILALLIAASIFTIYVGMSILARNVVIREVKNSNGTRRVVLASPAGRVEVQRDATADIALLGLPVYPGASRVPDNDSAAFSASFANQKQVGRAGVMAAKFQTPDALSAVADFYRSRLNGQVTHVIRKGSRGRTVFEVKGRGEEKIVVLRRADGGTRIELVKAVFGANEAN